jgi:transposase
MNSTTIAIDVAKSVFEVAVSEQPGQVRERQRLSLEQFRRFLTERPAATILMEACGSAHHWARHAQAHGHRAVLLPPHAVRPYVLRNKTYRADAKGLLEACRNEDVHPVPVKSETQQALAALHRLRSTWLATRTARINTIRGLLREFGLLIPGAHHVLPKVRLLLEDADSGVPGLLRPALAAAVQEIPEIDARIRAVEQQLEAAAAQALSVRQLRTIPGIGLLTATALVAAVGDVQRFPSARHFASYLGLTPREHSTGPRQRHGAISKRGDTYLRMLLIHGARSVLCRAKTRTAPPSDRLRAWAVQVECLRGHNKAAVALANKLARIAWGVWRHGTDYVGNSGRLRTRPTEDIRAHRRLLRAQRREGTPARTGARGSR